MTAECSTTIPLCEPAIGEREAAYVAEAMASGWVSSVGPFVERFENAFAAAVGARHAVACASGTAALHLALVAEGVGPGDLVLCSDCTFIASANPARYCGAAVGLIDSESQSWNMDPVLFEQAVKELADLGRLPKAVVLVHLYGAPADIGPIFEVSKRYGVSLIEDATEALGATYTAAYPHAACAGRQVGTVGRVGCFSFNGNKLITCGGGGMVVTDDTELAGYIRHLSTQAKLPGVGYVHDAIGFNYRLTNVAAAIGCAQLEHLDDFLQAKRRLAVRYREALPGWRWQEMATGCQANDWLPTACMAQRDRLLQHLHRQAILARPAWQPLSTQVPYRDALVWSQGIAAGIHRDGISLPASVHLSPPEIERVIVACREGQT